VPNEVEFDQPTTDRQSVCTIVKTILCTLTLLKILFNH
jgi:hypothetical protein